MDNASNFELLCHLYYFVMLAHLESHGPRIFPPDLRGNESLLHFSSWVMKNRTNLSSYRQFLPRLTLTWISRHLHTIWFNLLAALWASILHYCGNHVIGYVDLLRVKLVEGKLERISEEGHIRGHVTQFAACIEFLLTISQEQNFISSV